jgi:hypothetical protein
VVEPDGDDGRMVTLDITMDDARLEDVLRLAVTSAEPPMTGALNVRAAFVLPPGPGDAIDKMGLNGSFQIATARFRKGRLQERLNDLSQKARGAPAESSDEAAEVVSAFTGRFTMRRGVISFRPSASRCRARASISSVRTP